MTARRVDSSTDTFDNQVNFPMKERGINCVEVGVVLGKTTCHEVTNDWMKDRDRDWTELGKGSWRRNQAWRIC